MTEIITNLYVKHDDPHIFQQLEFVFPSNENAGDADDETVIALLKDAVLDLNPELGDQLVDDLLEEVEDPVQDLVAEDRYTDFGYHTWSFNHSYNAVEVIEGMMLLLGTLYPEVDVRAYMYGDDDPLDSFFRWQDGGVQHQDYEPQGDERDGQYPPAYVWWHEDLPEGLMEGYLNDPEEKNEDDEDEEAEE